MKKKILFFIYDLSGGGAENILVNLVNHLDKDKYDIEVRLLINRGINIKKVSDNIKISYVFKKKVLGLRVILKFFSPDFLFKKMIGDDYDLVISFFEGVTTRIVGGAKNRVKIINWVHISFDDFQNQLKAYRSENEMKNAYNSFNMTVCVAKTVQESFLRKLSVKKDCVKVIYNFMDIPKLIEKSNEEFNSFYSKEYFNIISVGRLTYQKGYDRLIEIIHNLRERIDVSFRLYILGEGDSEKKLKKMVKEYHLEEQIFFLGYQDNPYKYIKNADLFVCSSRKEGYSTVISESLLLETPVISTDCSGVKEQLGNQNEFGLMVTNDSNSLAESLKEVLNNSTMYTQLKKKSLAGKINITSRVSIENYELLFDEIISRDEGF